MPESVFDNVMNEAHTASQCVGGIIKAIFGEKILLKSTVTGRVSNKSVSKGSNNNDIEKLDPILLGICKGMILLISY